MAGPDPEEIKPGDLVRLENSDSDWRVVEPVEERSTAHHSGKLIAICIKGSPSLGGWKPARRIVEHVPRGCEFEEPEREQAELTEVTG
jgi:hypothetical protein